MMSEVELLMQLLPLVLLHVRLTVVCMVLARLVPLQLLDCWLDLC